MDSVFWQSLPAVKAGHVFTYNLKTCYLSDAYALDKQLDEIVAAFFLLTIMALMIVFRIIR
ncbi:hypothetical protein [Paenibacillus sp.]|uniref:hypothetical protein n=1 Tax=Paenibacillus sp. TaxID=58172 RepID=UPI0028B0AEAC|nr:hypothetical protein [Paenibacillus sp.]